MPVVKKSVLWWLFAHMFHTDEANAALHCADVQYSPLTFRLAEELGQYHRGELDSKDELYMFLGKVLDHKGKYEEDKGR